MFRSFVAKIIAAEAVEKTDSGWVRLFRNGWNDIEGIGKVLVDSQSWASILAHFNRRGNEIVFDYEHQTLSGKQAPAAGWGGELKFDISGLWAAVKWTEKAAKYIKDKEYRYHSPVFGVGPDKRVKSIHSVALTNSPRTNNLKPILAKLELEITQNKGDVMNEKLLKLLGLADGASEDAIEKAVLKLVSAKVKPSPVVVAKEIVDAIGADDDSVSAVVASVHALKQANKNSVSRDEFDKLLAANLKRDVNEIVAKALDCGKIAPNQEEWAVEYATSDIDGFKMFLAKAVPVIPIGGVTGPIKEKAETQGLSETDLIVAKQMDVSEEDLKKYGLEIKEVS